MALQIIRNADYLKYESEEKSVRFKSKKLTRLPKRKKCVTSLWKKLPNKKRRNFNGKKENKRCFFYSNKSLLEVQLKLDFADFVQLYNENYRVEGFYREYIQHNPLNHRAYNFFYNRLSAKIQILQIIDTDQGTNLALNPNLATKLLSLFLYSLETITCLTLLILGAGARFTLKRISDLGKIEKAHHKLKHCITDNNFIKLLSILLVKIHEIDFAHQERLDLFLEEQFKHFWSIFKKRIKENPNKENVNQFWSDLLFRYYQELECSFLKESLYICLRPMVTSKQITPEKLKASYSNLRDFSLPERSTYGNTLFFQPNYCLNSPLEQALHNEYTIT